MPGWLQHIRNKSPETRKRIALGTSAAVTSLVFVMWVTVMNHGFIDSSPATEQLQPNQAQTASPLSAFSDNAGAAFQELKESFQNSATSTTTELATTTTEANTDNEAPQGQITPRSDTGSYWEGSIPARSSTDTRGETNDPEDEETDTTDEQESEPFYSRNYNPNEASDWLVE